MLPKKRITGTMELELTSAEIETALTALNEAGISLIRLTREGELTCRFSIAKEDYPQLLDLCANRGETLRVLNRRGLYWKARNMKKRPVLLAGLVLSMMLLFLPTRVLFVQVKGNERIPEKKILEAAEYCGICFGAARREVRSEKMKNALLSAVPQLQWAGVNTIGCVAVISVREGAEQETQPPEKKVSSIVAARDGYVVSGTVTRGTGLFHVGQTVKEGQVLISGYTDCGIYIQANSAEGEIFAQTVRSMEAVTPSEYSLRSEITGVKKKYSLLFRKKRINLWKDSGISDSSCGRMYEEYYITLPGGFRMPVALCVEKYANYRTNIKLLPQESVEPQLLDFSRGYLSGQMIAGAIEHKAETVSLEDGLYRFRGTYTCTEMIGREQPEQIGDINGKNS